MDYLSYWGLSRRPFVQDGHGQDDHGIFFSAGPQREALAGLGYFIAGSWNSAFLIAPGRSGMTWLLSELTQTSGFGDCAAEVVLTSGVPADHKKPSAAIAAQLAKAIGLPTTGPDPVAQICDAIEATSKKGIRTVWLIDNCAVAGAQLARDLVMADGDLSVVMGIDPSQLSQLTAVFGRCCMQLEIEPLGLADALSYVPHALSNARSAGSASQVAIFTDASIVRIHEIAEGRMANVAALAEASLIQAAIENQRDVTPKIVESATSALQAAA
ncbi:hypothetical protein K227x_29670 [Rubripirellula lacrimiformis]|uniref:Uncharacterized protein n=1 Tax=Rubripirellula lacrimiformis TaxID=1930273 RepID=A0A517NBQ8_9BACT|nr:hypothetical protein [Rubripirellula lacrimiformis]QDT04575.1 hypothetical protein K227x_29670 [Rubripirellula lacrimiformis]